MHPINRALFTYLISDKEPDFLYNNRIKIKSSKFNIYFSKNTQCHYSEEDNYGIYVLGFCIDSVKELDREFIPKYLLKVLKTEKIFGKFLNRTDRLAGKYIILIKRYDNLYLVGDATGSLQINYNLKNNYMISSHDEIIANELDYKISDYSKKIRNGSDFSQPMPYNLTMYDYVKILLPGYFLDIKKRKHHRFFYPNNKMLSRDQSVKLIKSQIQTISNITKEYSKYYELVCPLTSGYDSRLNFAFLNMELRNFKCFTFRHDFKNSSAEIKIPNQICREFGIEYEIVKDLNVCDQKFKEIKKYIGKYLSRYTIDLAFTYKNKFENKALVNGDIIDQIGKSLIGNSLPNWTASRYFFKAKLHNSEQIILRDINQHLKSISSKELSLHKFDLFALENRLGRWSSQTNNLYSLMGVNSLNIYNCRKIIFDWMRIPRALRSANIIHSTIYETINHKLKRYPFNQDNKFNWVKKRPFTFLMATYLKQFFLTKRKK